MRKHIPQSQQPYNSDSSKHKTNTTPITPDKLNNSPRLHRADPPLGAISPSSSSSSLSSQLYRRLVSPIIPPLNSMSNAVSPSPSASYSNSGTASPSSIPPLIVVVPVAAEKSHTSLSHYLVLSVFSAYLYIVCSFLYFSINLLRNYYHISSHSRSLLFMTDVALLVLNLIMLMIAMLYWVVYAEKKQSGSSSTGQTTPAKRKTSTETERRQQSQQQSHDTEKDTDNEQQPGADRGTVVTLRHEIDDLSLEDDATDDDDADSTDALLIEPADKLFASNTNNHSNNNSSSGPSKTTLAQRGAAAGSILPIQFFSVSVLLSTFTSTFFLQSSVYLTCLDGVAEMLNIIGCTFYLLSSCLPLPPSFLAAFELEELDESVEATLDEMVYTLDAMAMILFVIGSLMYFYLWQRDQYRQQQQQQQQQVQQVVVVQQHQHQQKHRWLYDGEFWSHMWNIAGSICYAFSVFYGLSIRIHLAEREHLNLGAAHPPPPSSPTHAAIPIHLNTNASAVSNHTSWVSADDYSDLTVWQRALYGLTAQQRLMMSMGDFMYLVCAICVVYANRQQGYFSSYYSRKQRRKRERQKQQQQQQQQAANDAHSMLLPVT